MFSVNKICVHECTCGELGQCYLLFTLPVYFSPCCVPKSSTHESHIKALPYPLVSSWVWTIGYIKRRSKGLRRAMQEYLFSWTSLHQLIVSLLWLFGCNFHQGGPLHIVILFNFPVVARPIAL